MSSTDGESSSYTRRSFLGTSLSIASVGAVSLLFSNNVAADSKLPHSKLQTYNGGTEPYPIPWLDKNGNHNQPAGPQLEPSHIYHFKGESPVVQGSLGWARTIKATELRSAHPQRTTDICRENTLRVALHMLEHSLIYDSPCLRGRLLLKTKFTIFILLFPLRVILGASSTQRRTYHQS